MAKEILATKKAEAVKGRYELPTKKASPHLEDFVKDYFAYYQANRRPRSVTRHEVSWHAIEPVLGRKRLQEIAPFDLERYRRQRKQAGKSDVTINRELAFLRHVYTMAITWGKAHENPVKKYGSRARIMAVSVYSALTKKRSSSPCVPHTSSR